MQFIPFCENQPVFDVLPVMKTRHYFSDIKPLSYARAVYVEQKGFCFDLMKFERDPVISNNGSVLDTDSFVAISFQFSKSSGSSISIAVNAAGKNVVFLGDQETERLSDIYCYQGADEQGWYWAVRFWLTGALLEKAGTFNTFNLDTSIEGNIYCGQQSGDFKHFGAVAPFSEPSIFNPNNYDTFMLIN